MSKLFILVILVGFVILSIAFNWFDSRDRVDSLLGKAQEANQTIQNAGDNVSNAVDKIKDAKKAVE